MTILPSLIRRLAVVALCMAAGAADAGGVPAAVVETAPDGLPATRSGYALAPAGYVEREFFLSGVARSYKPQGLWGLNGAWSVAEQATHPYRTRVLARFPADAARFNGTVVVEWLNVTTGLDLDMDMAYLGEEILQRGYAWVGVSAQPRGLQGVKNGNPDRYGSLGIDSDDDAYDVFSQAAQAIRAPGSPILGGLVPQKLVAAGLSQSAQFMVTYANAIQPVAQVLDGFFIHGRPAMGFNVSGQQALVVPPVARIRTDLGVPVLQFQSEADVVNQAFNLARQPDTATVRTWELAGTSHIDGRLMDYISVARQRDLGGAGYECTAPNRLPTFRVAKAALRALDRWMRDGTPPPSQPRIALLLNLNVVVRDLNGWTVGGIQQPEYAVPLAKSGQLGWGDPTQAAGWNNTFLCLIAGYSTPLSDGAIQSRYRSRSDYLTRFKAAADAAVQAGFLLPDDAAQALRDAQARSLPLPP